MASGMKHRAALVALVLTAACSSPAPPPPSSPTDPPTATPAPVRSATPVPTQTSAPTHTPALSSPSPSPPSEFPEPSERLAGVSLAEAEQRALPLCDATTRPALAAPEEAQRQVPGPIELGVVGQLGGRPRAAVSDGGRLFVGVGPRVVAFETRVEWQSAGQSPILPGLVADVAVQGGLLVAAIGDAGIAVLDPENLSLLGSLELPGQAHAVAIEDGVAHVAAGSAGLHVIDLSDSGRPRSVGEADVDAEALDVAARDGLAFVAAGSAGLLVIDVADPQSPKVLGRVETEGHAFAAQIDGSTAYLADGWGGLGVVDVSDPARPTVLGSLATAGWAHAVTVVGRVASVATGSQGLVTADVGNPAAPVLLGTALLAGRQAVDLAVIDDRAYVVDPFEGVQIVDLASPASPRPVATWQPLLEAWGVSRFADRAYVAAGRAGLRALDVSDPAHPRETDALSTRAVANAVNAAGGNMLLSTIPDPASKETYSLIEVDVSDSALLRSRNAYGQLGRFGLTTFPPEDFIFGTDRLVAPPGPATGLATSGSVAVYATEWGILIVDVGANGPCELAFLQTWPGSGSGEATAATVNGETAYVGVAGGFEVLALDISDPHSPRVLSTQRASVGRGALVNGRWLYTVGYGAQEAGSFVDVFDVGDPADPRRVGSLRIAAEPPYLSAQTMTFSAGRLFVAAYESGVLAIDVSTPARPRLAGQLEVPGNALSVSGHDQYLYVGTDEGGLVVVDVGAADGPAPPDQPAEPGFSGLTAPVDRAAVAIAAADPPRLEPGCVVTTTADGGPGSLRHCLESSGPGGAVTFDAALFSPEQPATISLSSHLTPRSGGVSVDGGGGVILDGSGAVESVIALNNKDGVTLRGLRIQGFLTGLIVDSNGNTIEGNVIAGNGIDLTLARASGNRVVRNLVSVDPSGTALAYDPQAESPPFDINLGSAMNHIEGNVFGGGVYVADPGSYNNTLVANRIGVDVNGRTLPCPFCQLVVDEPFNRIGGSAPGDENLIAVRLVAQPGNVVLNNEIRTRE